MKTNSTIGIIGNGLVGSALYQSFRGKYNTKVYDIIKEKSYNTLEETLDCNIIFICLPTPMIPSAEESECNLTIINDFFDLIQLENKNLFVIKSTIPIGTTTKLKNRRTDLKIVHNPEFLTSINAVEDFQNSYRNIIGGSQEEAEPLVNLLQKMFPNALNIVVSSDESEMIKYFANTFLATKVTFFNLIYDMCEKMNANYNNVVNGVCSDDRIGFSHTKVPGPDGDKGFGGTCFPKDITSLIHTFKKLDLHAAFFEQIWFYNKKIRKNNDWLYSKSSTLKE